MSVIVELKIPAEDFPKDEVLGGDPSVRIHLEHAVPLGRTGIPYFRIRDGSRAAIERALEDEPDLVSYEVVDSVGDEALVRVEWAEGADGFIDALVRTNGALLRGRGHDGTWEIELRFDDHDDLTAFYHHCLDAGVSLTLRRMHNPGIPSPEGDGFSLTERQRETLLTAFEEGYFEVPRRTDMIELAEMLGVSDTAVSQRLRRGLTRLLVATLAERERTADAGPPSNADASSNSDSDRDG